MTMSGFNKIFSKIQESQWYSEFLAPVVVQINRNSHVLDVGTGSGKLVQLLSENKSANCVGIDKSEDMLSEAKQKVNGNNVVLHKIKAGEPYPFATESFDYITICNVLFNLDVKAQKFILDESFRLLKPNGVIIVLTPTGKNGPLKLAKHFLSIKNTSVFIWYFATRTRGRAWQTNNQLAEYGHQRNADYQRKEILHGFALVETLSKY